MRELTDIEEEILGSVVRKIVQELSMAWKPLGLQMSFERREMEDQLERMMPPIEKMSRMVIMGLRNGMVMKRACWYLDAPSMTAAS